MSGDYIGKLRLTGRAIYPLSTDEQLGVNGRLALEGSVLVVGSEIVSERHFGIGCDNARGRYSSTQPPR
jgi:hypothetical protein